MANRTDGDVWVQLLTTQGVEWVGWDPETETIGVHQWFSPVNVQKSSITEFYPRRGSEYTYFKLGSNSQYQVAVSFEEAQAALFKTSYEEDVIRLPNLKTVYWDKNATAYVCETRKIDLAVEFNEVAPPESGKDTSANSLTVLFNGATYDASGNYNTSQVEILEDNIARIDPVGGDAQIHLKDDPDKKLYVSTIHPAVMQFLIAKAKKEGVRMLDLRDLDIKQDYQVFQAEREKTVISVPVMR